MKAKGKLSVQVKNDSYNALHSLNTFCYLPNQSSEIPLRFQNGGVIGSANESSGQRLMRFSSFPYRRHPD